MRQIWDQSGTNLGPIWSQPGTTQISKKILNTRALNRQCRYSDLKSPVCLSVLAENMRKILLWACLEQANVARIRDGWDTLLVPTHKLYK